MPRTSFRRAFVAFLLAFALAASASAGQLGAGRERAQHHRPTSFWTVFFHLIGASGGTFDPNGWR